MMCPAYNADNIPENSTFCNVCGVNLVEAKRIMEAKREEKERIGEIPMAEKELIADGKKNTIKVFCKDVTELDEKIDLLTISAYPYSYYPTPRSVIGALKTKLTISVDDLAKKPFLDLRENAGCWVSQEIQHNKHFRRIGGVEIPFRTNTDDTYESRMIQSIKSYMYLLDILTEQDPNIKVVVVPFLGTGDMHLNYSLLAFPLINEITRFLTRNRTVQTILFIEKNYEKAKVLADSLNSSYNLLSKSTENTFSDKKQSVFVSYANKTDRPVADKIYEYLKEKGISYWFAPANIVVGDYAAEIVKGINKCTHFICIISESSMKSPHVLNEVDLAFQRIGDGVKIIPFRLDESSLEPAFKYYLSRMQSKPAFRLRWKTEFGILLMKYFNNCKNNKSVFVNL